MLSLPISHRSSLEGVLEFPFQPHTICSIVYDPKFMDMSLKSTIPRKKSCQQSETLLPETVANLGPSAVKVSPSIFPFSSRIVISYVLPAFWFPFVERVSKGTEKVQAQQVEWLLIFSPPSYPHWPTYLQLRYIRRWALFVAVSNMRWSGVRIRMTYIAAVGHNLIPPGMHRYASRFTLSNVFLVSSYRTTTLFHAWWRASLSWFKSNAEYAMGSPTFFILFFYTPLVLTWALVFMNSVVHSFISQNLLTKHDS